MQFGFLSLVHFFFPLHVLSSPSQVQTLLYNIFRCDDLDFSLRLHPQRLSELCAHCHVFPALPPSLDTSGALCDSLEFADPESL